MFAGSGAFLLWFILKIHIPGCSWLLLTEKKNEAFTLSTSKEILFPLSLSCSYSLPETPPPTKPRQKNEMRIKTHPSSSPLYDIPERPAGSDESTSRGRAGSAPDFSGAQTSYDSPSPDPAPSLSRPQTLPLAYRGRGAGGRGGAWGAEEARTPHLWAPGARAPPGPSARSSPASPLGVSLA